MEETMASSQTEVEMPSKYDLLVITDIISIARPLLEKHGYVMRDDGKFIIPGGAYPIWETPWLHVRRAWWDDCLMGHHIIFNIIQPAMQKAFVPRACQNCYKVVARPQTLEQLFALYELQKKLNLPSKCGIEVRPTVKGLYGGYWYAKGLEQGKQLYQVTRKAVSEDKALGPDVPMLLKRACTEFEMKCGPSDKWEITPEQNAWEDMLDRYIVRDIHEGTQPEPIIIYTMRKWIEWAYANGDETYKKYTNGKPIYEPYVTYHQEK